MKSNIMSNEEFVELLNKLEQHQGKATSMITLLVPASKQSGEMGSFLRSELSECKNIKNPKNRKSVEAAIESTKKRLQEYKTIPANGLAIFCGTTFEDNGKADYQVLSFEPIKAITRFFYRCDNRFHTEDLMAMLDKEDLYGFIIVDGNGALYGTAQGDNKKTLKKFSVELPNNHNKGGQSSLRFARLREEKIVNYIRKVSETANELFVKEDRVVVKGLIIAGSGDIKNQLTASLVLDARIREKVMTVLDISSSEEQGFQEAFEKAEGCISKGVVEQEKKDLSAFMEHVRRADGRASYGFKETIAALKMRQIETVIVYEKLDLYRVKLVDGSKAWAKADELDSVDVASKKKVTKWLEDKAKKYKAKVVMFGNKSAEANDLIYGFGGLVGILKKGSNFVYEEENQVDAQEEEEVVEEVVEEKIAIVSQEIVEPVQQKVEVIVQKPVVIQETIPVVTAEPTAKPARKKLRADALGFKPKTESSEVRQEETKENGAAPIQFIQEA